MTKTERAALVEEIAQQIDALFDRPQAAIVRLWAENIVRTVEVRKAGWTPHRLAEKRGPTPSTDPPRRGHISDRPSSDTTT